EPSLALVPRGSMPLQRWRTVAIPGYPGIATAQVTDRSPTITPMPTV
ncbi:MAG: hypothetical protein AVDCRST_MAG06-661, partial [uncultured Nocardioides sp.]